MQITKKIAVTLVAGILVACAPTVPATPTGVMQPTPTVTAAPAFDILPLDAPQTPQEDPLIRIRMFDETSGWGIFSSITSPCNILHTTDSGQSWNDTTPNPQMTSQNCDVFFLNAQQAWVISTEDVLPESPRVIYHTSDGGTHWEQYKNLPFKTPTRLTFSDASQGWALEAVSNSPNATYPNAYETVDGGKTWKLLALKDPLGDNQQGNFRSAGQNFAFINTNDIWLGGNNNYVVEPSIQFFASHDAGQTWKKIEIAPPSSPTLNLGQQLVYSTPVFITTHDAYFTVLYDQSPNNLASIFLSHDGGQTWEVSQTLLEGFGGKTYLQFLSGNDALVDCGNTLCISHDGAKTWQPIQANVSFLSDEPEKNKIVSGFYFINLSTGWAVSIRDGKREILKTTDGGKTWVASPLVVRNQPTPTP